MQQVGEYTIHRKVAEGGMGEIYLGSRTGIFGFARQVALKRISPLLAHNQAYVKMFLREARISALLDHPNVVQVYELVEQDGEYFLVMEYVPGLSLSRLLGAVAGALALPVAIQIAARVAAGLHFVHEMRDDEGRPLGLVHRDVSPANILLSRWGGVKLTDFGIAKYRVASALGQIGSITGKYSYLAPEQVRGDPVDSRSDIYALGLVLYEMTTGQRPYQGQDPDVLSAAETGRFPPPEHARPDYPDDLRAVLMRMLSFVPDSRYPSCNELERDLVGLLTRRGVASSADLVADFIRQHLADKPRLEEASPPPLAPIDLRSDTTHPALHHLVARPRLLGPWKLVVLAVGLLLAALMILVWIGRP